MHGVVVSKGEYLQRLTQIRQSHGPAAMTSHCPAAMPSNLRDGQSLSFQPLSAVGRLVAASGGTKTVNAYGHGGSSGSNSVSVYADPLGMPGVVGVETQLCAQAPARTRSDALAGMAPSKGRQVGNNFINHVVEQCGPAVVRVETEQKVELPEIDNADIFSFFFGQRPDSRIREKRVHGHGSGFCIDGTTGIVLTNAHVVQGADRVTVSFAGRGAPLECDVMETDEVIDVAVLKVKELPKGPLPMMPLGASETVRTGDWAVVLGNPFGLNNTCTLGIVSSLDRSTGETGFDWMRHPLLQTDAAVNQGNSGGPMLNEIGEVIGMISMRALFGEGIGFAVPAASIRSALPSLLHRKKVPRAYIGLKMSATQSDSDKTKREGALVEMVLPRSPAQAAGFETEDRILELNGKKVRHFDEVQAIVRTAQVGSKLSFKVKRDGETRSITVEAADVRKLRENREDALNRSGPRHRVIIVP